LCKQSCSYLSFSTDQNKAAECYAFGGFFR
jgi:hypothetical protein